MNRLADLRARPRLWIELFALVNLAGLAPDIYLAHSVNAFHHPAEYVPLVYSLLAPLLLALALWGLAGSRPRLWKLLGAWVGWGAIVVGVAGLALHLDSQFFQRWTLASLVYAAPFAAPLAYTGIGLLLILNRMLDESSLEWPQWVVFLALGGFAGNFVISALDHAQNGFYQPTEWIPVISSALAVGFLVVPLLFRVAPAYLRTCGWVMLLQALVGLGGFGLHFLADLHGVGATLFERIVHGAPVFAPLLFVDLALLACIGLRVLHEHLELRRGEMSSASA